MKCIALFSYFQQLFLQCKIEFTKNDLRSSVSWKKKSKLLGRKHLRMTTPTNNDCSSSLSTPQTSNQSSKPTYASLLKNEGNSDQNDGKSIHHPETSTGSSTRQAKSEPSVSETTEVSLSSQEETDTSVDQSSDTCKPISKLSTTIREMFEENKGLRSDAELMEIAYENEIYDVYCKLESEHNKNKKLKWRIKYLMTLTVCVLGYIVQQRLSNDDDSTSEVVYHHPWHNVVDTMLNMHCTNMTNWF